MAWPPDPIAADVNNETLAADVHPGLHNELAEAINDLVDYVDIPAGAFRVLATEDEAVADANPEYVWIILDPLPEAPDVAPANLAATAVSDTRIDLSWDAVTGATGYEYDVDEGTPVDVGNNLTAQVTGLTADTSYDFRVRAYNAAGEGPWSAVVAESTDETPAAGGSFEVVDSTTVALASSGTSLVVPLPDHDEGDLLLVFAQGNTDGNQNPSCSDGFSREGFEVGSEGTSRIWNAVFAKVATASEPASVTVSWATSIDANQASAVAVSVGSPNESTPFNTPGTFNTTDSVSTVTAPGQTAGSNGSLLLCAFGTRATGGVDPTITLPAGMTLVDEILGGGGSSSQTIAVASESVDEGSTGTRTATLSPSSRACAVSILVNP